MKLSKDWYDTLKLAASLPLILVLAVSPPIALMKIYDDTVGESALSKACERGACSTGVGPVWLSSRRVCACLVPPMVKP